MERESFKDEEIGKILSDNFVCIKLDREERPDVDKVYMTFVQVCVFLVRLFFSTKVVFCIWLFYLFIFVSGNKWWWRLAHECVVNSRPSTFYRRYLLPPEGPRKKTRLQDSSDKNH